MIILNFSHPLTDRHLEQVEAITRQPLEDVIDLQVQFDADEPFTPQLRQLLEGIRLSPADLQNKALLINPPSLNFITALLLAELHGRMGYFPTILRTRPVKDSIPTQYEVAEILNLQDTRDKARRART